MAVKKYLFRAEEGLFDTVEQIREKLNISTTKDALVFLINSGVAAVCMHHNININNKKEAEVIQPVTTINPPIHKEEFTLLPEDEEELTVEEG
jgi:hypothetical protein